MHDAEGRRLPGGSRPWLRRAAGALALAVAAALAPAVALAADVTAASGPDAALDARTMALSAQLRCLVCQNQTIADSNAELAVDLRRQVRALLAAGRSDDEAIAHLTARYGDFVLYRPPLNASTALLWGGPALLFAAAMGALAVTLRRRATAPDDAFEPDPEAPPPAVPAPLDGRTA